MSDIDELISRSKVHPEWRDILGDALSGIDPDYIASLLQKDNWIPGSDRLLAAFQRDRRGLAYLLIGESPYPRRESANGIAFYDAAVGKLWSEQGLSKPVNRATSLRNIIKTALLAEGYLQKDADGKISQSAIAGIDKTPLIESLDEFFDNLQQAGFLMLNATPVLHDSRKPALEAGFWQGFLERLLVAIAKDTDAPVTLLLWGKIAQRFEAIPASDAFARLVCEHPYNLSFIDNAEMQALFARLAPLTRKHKT